jgi:hypothetical protein
VDYAHGAQDTTSEDGNKPLGFTEGGGGGGVVFCLAKDSLRAVRVA